jgi:cytosine/adenosine deaminase-related metal-dependent hydrolase
LDDACDRRQAEGQLRFRQLPAAEQEKGQPIMPRELLIKGGHVVTVDPELGDLPVGDVLVTDDVITAVGTGLEPASAGAEVIDAAGRLVIPGLVDTHRHVWQGAIGGYTPQITGAGYGPVVLTGIALKHSPDDVYAGTLWGALQALGAGITTVADWAHNDQSPAHADADLRGLAESGIRGYFLYGGPGPAGGDPDPPHPADARRVRDQYFGSGRYGRLRMGMALRGPAFTSAGRNRADFGFARELGLPISLHAGMAGTGHAVAVLDRDGLLGADVNYVHGNFLTDREWDLVAGSGATIGGARVWQLEDEIGTLTPGKQADIAIIDLRSPHLDGYGDPVAVAVQGAGPADVETVIVGGDIVKRQGQLVGSHVSKALDLMHQTRDRLRRGLS